MLFILSVAIDVILIFLDSYFLGGTVIFCMSIFSMWRGSVMVHRSKVQCWICCWVPFWMEEEWLDFSGYQVNHNCIVFGHMTTEYRNIIALMMTDLWCGIYDIIQVEWFAFLSYLALLRDSRWLDQTCMHMQLVFRGNSNLEIIKVEICMHEGFVCLKEALHAWV
jgi:hypothetical protein